MSNIQNNFEKIEGVINDIYEDFDTIEDIIKGKAVAFRLDIIDNKEKNGKDNKENKRGIIIVYDKNAIELGLIKVGNHLTCFGNYCGTITVVDSKHNILEDKMFLCMGIMGDAEIDEEQLISQGAIRLR